MSKEDELTAAVEAHIARLRRIFDHFDRDSDGHLTTEEIGLALQELGQPATPDEIHRIIASVDEDGNGMLEFPEFVELLEAPATTPDGEINLRHTFNMFDLDSDGYLTEEELKMAIADAGFEITGKELKAIFHNADLKVDGKVSYEEFLILMTRD